MVIETFDGQLLANIADKLYLIKEVAEHVLVSKEFDAPKEEPKKEKKTRNTNSNGQNNPTSNRTSLNTNNRPKIFRNKLWI